MTFPASRRWIAVSLAGTLLLAFGVWIQTSNADPTGTGPNDKYIAKVVAKYLNDEHLSKHKVDDEMSERAFKAFLKSLDPLKLYFTAADVAEFSKDEKQLDDMILRGDVSFGFKVYTRYLQRVDERLKQALTLLEQPHDFTIDEEFVSDGKKIEWAKDDAEIADRWRRRVKFDLLVQKADKVELAEAKIKLGRRYNSFAKRMHQIGNEDLVEIFLTSMTTGFDPHTTYMSASTVKNFDIQMRLNLDGIGASLQYDDGYTKVNKIIPGGPAEKDGRLKADDRITAVAQGTSDDFTDVVDMNLNDVVKQIRGQPGTVVRLKVMPGGKGESKIYDIKRRKNQAHR